MSYGSCLKLEFGEGIRLKICIENVIVLKMWHREGLILKCVKAWRRPVSHDRV